VANRVPGVRCAVYYGGPVEILTLSRAHNNANILSLGAEFTDETLAKQLVSVFLETPFSPEERHVRRLREIEEIENRK